MQAPALNLVTCKRSYDKVNVDTWTDAHDRRGRQARQADTQTDQQVA